MSAKEWTRKQTLERHQAGELTTAEAARILKVTTRQVRRLSAKYVQGSPACVRHGLCGRSPANKTSTAKLAKAVTLFTSTYRGFNDTHFVECLKEDEGVEFARSTWQRLARSAGLKATRRRRSRRYRGRRIREGQAGKMILWDGSFHDWLEGRGPKMCMMAAVDDATGALLPGAHFVPQESAAGYLRVLASVVGECGIPTSIYMDRHGSLKRNDGYWTLEEELRGEQAPTHVGQALRDFGIESIFALSPQAKGRVERLWGTLQDRLVSELRRRGISTLEDANVFLNSFRPAFNRRFNKTAREATTAWRKVPPAICVEDACAFRYESTVSNDNLVSIDGVKLQIPRPAGGRSFAQARVQVRQRLNGLWRVFYKGHCIAELCSDGVANEVHARRKRKRSAASQAFREAVRTFEAPPDKVKTKRPRKTTPIRPFNYWSEEEKARAAAKSKKLREERPAFW
jgi:nitrogen fixation protein FixH